MLSSRGAIALLLSVAATLVAPVYSSAQSYGAVYPPNAIVRGYTLQDFVVPVSSFNQTGNTEMSLYPKTVVQVLYSPNNPDPFVVNPGTCFFVPLWGIDDSAPILAFDNIFPATHEEAVYNFFSPDQCGARNFAIYVDGVKTDIGPAYLVGPETSSAPMPWGGTHVYMLCAFVNQMAKGNHTVRIVGGLYGPIIPYLFGKHGVYGRWDVNYLDEDITYNIVVR